MEKEKYGILIELEGEWECVIVEDTRRDIKYLKIISRESSGSLPHLYPHEYLFAIKLEELLKNHWKPKSMVDLWQGLSDKEKEEIGKIIEKKSYYKSGQV